MKLIRDAEREARQVSRRPGGDPGRDGVASLRDPENGRSECGDLVAREILAIDQPHHLADVRQAPRLQHHRQQRRCRTAPIGGPRGSAKRFEPDRPAAAFVAHQVTEAAAERLAAGRIDAVADRAAAGDHDDARRAAGGASEVRDHIDVDPDRRGRRDLLHHRAEQGCRVQLALGTGEPETDRLQVAWIDSRGGAGVPQRGLDRRPVALPATGDVEVIAGRSVTPAKHVAIATGEHRPGRGLPAVNPGQQDLAPVALRHAHEVSGAASSAAANRRVNAIGSVMAVPTMTMSAPSSNASRASSGVP